MRLRIKENGQDVAVLEAVSVRYNSEYNDNGVHLYKVTTENNAVFNLLTKENIVETICDSINMPYITLECNSFARFS